MMMSLCLKNYVGNLQMVWEFSSFVRSGIRKQRNRCFITPKTRSMVLRVLMSQRLYLRWAESAGLRRGVKRYFWQAYPPSPIKMPLIIPDDRRA